MKKRVHGYFVSNNEINKAKKVLAFIGAGSVAIRIIRFIFSPLRRQI